LGKRELPTNFILEKVREKKEKRTSNQISRLSADEANTLGLL